MSGCQMWPFGSTSVPSGIVGELSDHKHVSKGSNGDERVEDSGARASMRVKAAQPSGLLPPRLVPLQTQPPTATGMRHSVTTGKSEIVALWGGENEAPSR